MERMTGIPASAGLASGPVYLVRTDPVRAERTTVVDPAAEQARLDQALAQAAAEIESVRRRTAEKVGPAEAKVFEAHAQMLSDPALVQTARSLIESDHLAAAWAFQVSGEQMAEILATLDDPYLRERAADVLDVTARVVRILRGRPPASLLDLHTPSIIVAHDLTPSETALMDSDLVLGIATDTGGAASHMVLMARALGIPAVVGLGTVSTHAVSGDTAVLDGSRGELILQPDQAASADAFSRHEAFRRRQQALEALAGQPAVTTDGHRVLLHANIGRPADAAEAVRLGAEGVGLYRTESLYLESVALPTEEQQYLAYRQALEQMAPHPVIIRTLDAGGDKQLRVLAQPHEANPSLGLRAIRLCLEHRDLFKTQLKALLRAAVHGHLRIMYPLVQSLQELKAANALLREARMELENDGVLTGIVEVGILIEIPAAAVTADLLAPHVHFFSIGTNDLIQYTLAADRLNPLVSHLYQPYHPAVLRLVRQVCAAAHGAGKWAGLCGDLAGDPVAAPLLLGLGLDEWSMSPAALPAVKEIIRAVDRDECRALADQAIALTDPAAIMTLARAFYDGHVTDR